MRTRRWLNCVALGGLSALVTGVALTASGQDRPAAEAKYYQGKVSPPPPGLFSAGTVKSPGGAAAPALSPSGNIPTFGGQKPGAPFPTQVTLTPNPVQQLGGAPRLTQPVEAGPNGVRQVGATEPSGTPPFFTPTSPRPVTVPPTPNLLPPPSVNVDPAAPGLPEPKPLVTPKVEGAAVVMPTPVAPTTPVTPMPAPGVVPSGPKGKTFQETPATLPQTVLTQAGALPTRQVSNVVVETVCPEAVGVNQTLVYEIIVRNSGTASVQAVRVEDELPAKCQFVGSDPAAETAGDRLAWSIGQLEAGAERRIRVSVKPSEEGDLRSRAVVSFSAAVEARTKVTRPRIAVTMTGPETARVGEKVPFQIKLSNTGSGTAGKILLQAKFTDGLTHSQGQVIEAEIGNLPAGQTKTLNLEAVAGRSGAQLCTVTAAADGSASEGAKSAVNLVEPMLVVKQTGPSRCLVKGEPTYTIELSNPGTAATDPIQLWASLPPGIEFRAATDGGAFVEANRAVAWRLPALAAGGTKTVTFKVVAVTPTEGVVRTVAQAAAPGAESAGGVIAVENRSGGAKALEARTETALKAEGVPALRFEVADLEDPIEVGKEVTYEIRVVNQGTGACTNVQLVADLPETTSLAGSTGPTTGKVSGQQLTFEPIAQFGVKAEAVYRVRVKGTQPGDYRFRVRLACDQIRTPTTKEENTRFYKE